MHKICFTISLFHASTCFEHHVLIVRRSKLYYTASGIITHIGGRPVHRLREDWLECMGLGVRWVITHLTPNPMLKIVLYSLWYHHTYRWQSHAQVESNLCMGRPPVRVMIPEAV